LWAVPVAVSTLVGTSRSERTALWGSSTDPKFGVVGERSIDAAQPARLILERANSRSLVWPHAPGVVTSTSAFDAASTVGVGNGAVLFAVDAVAVLAQTTGEPLFRDIRLGMAGGDVRWVDELLVAVGAAERLGERGSTPVQLIVPGGVPRLRRGRTVRV
jgi:hypothetical protein